MLRAAVVVATIAAMLRAVVPLGFMVAAGEGGLSIVPCSGVVAIAATPSAAHAHAHHQDHQGRHGAGGPDDGAPAPDAEDHLASCPFAASCCSVIANVAEAAAAPVASIAAGYVKVRSIRAFALVRAFNARGPPLSL